MKRFFGTPDGIHVGQQFIDRRDLHEQHVHHPTQSGISGTKAEGADSIVLSGGYIDDEDHGDYLIYTGHGGKYPNSNRQRADQTVEAHGNAGLITSMVWGLPVRVTRKFDKTNPYAPTSGYRYAGLFTVTDVWTAQGRDGFHIVRFRLDRIPEQAQLWTAENPETDPAYSSSTVVRRIRDTALSREVKQLYQQKCQICGTVIPGIDNRFYAEGAHVKPLGRPHLGSDKLNNLLCLCPNHHTQLDLGGLIILDDLSIAKVGDSKPFADLKFAGSHSLEISNAKYHRNHWQSILISADASAAADRPVRRAEDRTPRNAHGAR